MSSTAKTQPDERPRIKVTPEEAAFLDRFVKSVLTDAEYQLVTAGKQADPPDK